MEHAVVTGGASGIGAAVVVRLLRRGLRVTVLDLAEPGVDSDRLRHARLDVTDPDAVENVMDQARAAFGPVTRLVTSHGIRGAYVPALELDVAQMSRMFGVHVIGTLLVARAMARQAAKAGAEGAVVTISSTTAYGGWANQSDYGVAKAAVSQLTQNLAIEWAPLGIRVNSVAPGHTLTPMMQQMIDRGYDVSATKARTPMGRLAAPEEVAAAIDNLLMDATFTTGVCLPVDGGWTSAGK